MVAIFRKIDRKVQIGRELDRLELLLEQIQAVEAERDALLAAEPTAMPAQTAMLLDIKGIGPEFAASSRWRTAIVRIRIPADAGRTFRNT